MFSCKAQKSVGGAVDYFEEHLEKGDYHSEGKAVAGYWFGKGAELLGLTGSVHEDDFVKLCSNINPVTGLSLTPRNRNGRRIFTDIQLSPPKSVSVMALLHDERIIGAHNKAVRLAVEELQNFASVREHDGLAVTRKETGTIVAAVFQHDTSRGVGIEEDGVHVVQTPDPQLHSHVILFNASYDASQTDPRKQWLALDNGLILEAQKFIDGVYYHSLRQEMGRLGYQFEDVGHSGFRVKGVSPEIEKIFSKRRRTIQEEAERLAKEKGGNVKAWADNLAHNQRERKIKELSAAELVDDWKSQLPGDADHEMAALVDPHGGGGSGASRPWDVEKDRDWAFEHSLERSSTTKDYDVLAALVGRVSGSSLSVSELKEAVYGKNGLIRRDRDLTTREVATEEAALLKVVSEGENAVRPIAIGRPIADERLSAEQREAAMLLLESRDRVKILRGKAGTGKSFTLREIAAGSEEMGHKVVVLAPQRRQVKALQEDGLEQAEVLTGFLNRGEVEKGSVIMVDEAGQLGTRDMLKLNLLAERNDCHLVLSGDTKQFSAVARGQSLRLIEQGTHVDRCVLGQIWRQKDALHRRGVELASDGMTRQSFAILEEIGAIKEVDANERLTELAAEASGKITSGDRTLVLSQTRAEVDVINERVRTQLVSEGFLQGDKSKAVQAWVKVDLTEAQKEDGRFMQAGDHVTLNQQVRNLKVGATYQVEQSDEKWMYLRDGEHRRRISWENAGKFELVQAKELEVCPGDQLQIKGNFRGDKGHLLNGEIVTVASVRKDGTIKLAGEKKREIPPDFRMFQRGYASTSYGGQGMTVDHTIISDSQAPKALNQAQWYVDISRSKQTVSVYTSDRETFRNRVCESNSEELGLELLGRTLDDDMRNFPPPPSDTLERLRLLGGGLQPPDSQEAVSLGEIKDQEAAFQESVRRLKALSRDLEGPETQVEAPALVQGQSARERLPELPTAEAGAEVEREDWESQEKVSAYRMGLAKLESSRAIKAQQMDQKSTIQTEKQEEQFEF